MVAGSGNVYLHTAGDYVHFKLVRAGSLKARGAPAGLSLEHLAGLLGGPGTPTALGASGPVVGRAGPAAGDGGEPGGV